MLVSEILFLLVSLYYGIFICLAVKSSYDEEWCSCCLTVKQQLHRMKHTSLHYYETVNENESIRV